MKKRPKFHSGKIGNPAAIAAIASPVRQEIIDTLEALGGAATVPELAAQLGRPADGLYYHVRQLARFGVLVAEDTGRVSRYRTASRAGAPLQLDYAPADPRNAAALRTVVGSMLRIARRDFDAGLAQPDVAVSGPRRTLRAVRNKGWLGPAELVTLNRLLEQIHALVRECRPRRASSQLVSVCFVTAPIEARARTASRYRRGSRPRS